MARLLYPKIKTNQTQWLEVEQGHQIYLETAGNPDGIPVLYLHGGPGGGCGEHHRRYFDPDKYFYISFDQRGCGRSKPSPNIDANTLSHLINDIEHVRLHFNIEQWLIVGGSWGTTLAMAYGIAFPHRVMAFILRGVFLATQAEYDWLYKADGAAQFFPDYYQDFLQPIDDKQDPLKAYQSLFSSDNEVAVVAASKAWFLWELRLSSMEHHHLTAAHIEDKHQALCMSQLSNYFFSNKCFLDENYIINHIDKISNIPAIVIHGRYDMVCQVVQAHRLVNVWDNATLQILPQAGHSGFESQTIDAMCKATDVMANYLQEKY